MIAGCVNSSELTTKSLRAGDYLVDPKKLADNLVRTWLKGTGLNKLLKVKSVPLLDLREEIATAVRIAYEKGQRSQGQALREAAKNIEALKKEKAADGQVGNMLMALGRLRSILGAHKGDDRAKGDFQSIIDAAEKLQRENEALRSEVRMLEKNLDPHGVL